jgi:hypothetical protein
MKTKQIFLVCTILLLTASLSFAQDSCKVLKPEIATTYVGKCKKGLAHGKGIATGTDKYDGSFKFGLPDGNGKYTWANGDTYVGEWKEGKRNGEGKFTYTVNGVDSSKYGMWENDVFVKKLTPAPYKTFMVKNVDRYSVAKTGDGDKVSLELIRMGKDNPNISNLDFFADNGTFRQVTFNYMYENVKFPVVIKISYTTSGKFETGGVSGNSKGEVSSNTGNSNIDVVFEVTINEPGNWMITLNN